MFKTKNQRKITEKSKSMENVKSSLMDKAEGGEDMRNSLPGRKGSGTNPDSTAP